MNLLKGLGSSDLNAKEKRDFISKISNINEYESELVYALIKMYQIENDSMSCNVMIPFEGDLKGNNIEFDLNKFPKKLKQMIYKFLKLNLESKNNI